MGDEALPLLSADMAPSMPPVFLARNKHNTKSVTNFVVQLLSCDQQATSIILLKGWDPFKMGYFDNIDNKFCK
jgi:hypothetical protein